MCLHVLLICSCHKLCRCAVKWFVLPACMAQSWAGCPASKQKMVLWQEDRWCSILMRRLIHTRLALIHESGLLCPSGGLRMKANKTWVHLALMEVHHRERLPSNELLQRCVLNLDKQLHSKGGIMPRQCPGSWLFDEVLRVKTLLNRGRKQRRDLRAAMLRAGVKAELVARRLKFESSPVDKAFH